MLVKGNDGHHMSIVSCLGNILSWGLKGIKYGMINRCMMINRWHDLSMMSFLEIISIGRLMGIEKRKCGGVAIFPGTAHQRFLIFLHDNRRQ